MQKDPSWELANQIAVQQRVQYGTFWPLFEPLPQSNDRVPGYLVLLNLDPRKAGPAVSLVLECSRKSSNPYQEIGRLLDKPDWRPHLVAAVALAALGYDENTFIKLWAAFDSGSWVAPQLAAVACLRDPNFADHARVRINSRCPVNDSRMNSMSPLERHVSEGPAGTGQRSAKAAASLISLLRLLHQQPEWLTAELLSPDLAALLSADIDQSGTIATGWSSNLKAVFKMLTIKID